MLLKNVSVIQKVVFSPISCLGSLGTMQVFLGAQDAWEQTPTIAVAIDNVFALVSSPLWTGPGWGWVFFLSLHVLRCRTVSTQGASLPAVFALSLSLFRPGSVLSLPSPSPLPFFLFFLRLFDPSPLLPFFSGLGLPAGSLKVPLPV